MSVDYWLGVATVPVNVATFVVVGEVWQWIAWWRQPQARGGRGLGHRPPGRSDHTHWWPPGTPWWLIRRFEPVRLWRCARAQAEGDN